MFVHQKCNTNVYLDLTDNIHFVTSFGLTKNGLKINQGDIIFENTSFSPIFYCPSCNKKIAIEEIKGGCSHCGELFPIKNLIKYLDGGGVYCQDCAKALLSDEPTKSLLAIFNKVLV